MKRQNSFTEGKILGPLLLFALPVLAALFLQAMYGAVDLLVVGQFGSSADVSGVSTGSQLMTTFTNMIASFSMGTTVLLGQAIGKKDLKSGGRIIGASIFFFGCVGIAMTVLLLAFAPRLATVMNAPEEAFSQTVSYIRICGGGSLVIIAYNLIGSIFRGMGDSRTPLITVAIACVCNIFGDLLLVAVFHMGTAGAAIATVAAQFVSVVISLFLIRKQELPFAFSRTDIRADSYVSGKVTKIGLPIALQDMLVGISFLIILAIVNALGLIASAGVGVAEKVCAFIMLVPSAFMQSLAAFTAQNVGADKTDRAIKGMFYAIAVSLCLGVVMGWASFFHGNVLAGIFSKDADVAAAAADYLKAYAIDCLLTPIFFCFIGFYNGLGKTRFVMAQGILGAFCVRVPVSYIMSKQTPASLFHIGLATPCSSLLQTILAIWYFLKVKKELTGHRRTEQAV